MSSATDNSSRKALGNEDQTYVEPRVRSIVPGRRAAGWTGIVLAAIRDLFGRSVRAAGPRLVFCGRGDDGVVAAVEERAVQGADV